MGIDLRAQGIFQGMAFNRENDVLGFRSTFAGLGGRETTDYIPLNDPQFTNVMWNVGRDAAVTEFIVKPPVVWTLWWVYSGGLPGGR